MKLNFDFIEYFMATNKRLDLKFILAIPPVFFAWSCTTLNENPYFAGKRLPNCPIKVSKGIFATAEDPDINQATEKARQLLINEYGLVAIDLKPKREAECVNSQDLIQVSVGISEVDALAFHDESLNKIVRGGNDKFAQLQRAIISKSYEQSWTKIVKLFDKGGMTLPSSGVKEASTGPDFVMIFNDNTPQNVLNGIKDAFSDLGLHYRLYDQDAHDLIVAVEVGEEIIPPLANSNHRFVRTIINLTFTEDGKVVASKSIDIKGGGLSLDQAKYQASTKVKDSMRNKLLEYLGGSESWSHQNQ